MNSGLRDLGEASTGFDRLSLRRPASGGANFALPHASTQVDARLRQAQPAPAGIEWGVLRPTTRVHAGGRPAVGPSGAISIARLFDSFNQYARPKIAMRVAGRPV